MELLSHVKGHMIINVKLIVKKIIVLVHIVFPVDPEEVLYVSLGRMCCTACPAWARGTERTQRRCSA